MKGGKTMKQAIHLLDPVIGNRSNHTMRCGRSQNLNSVEEPKYTRNPDEVTCTKCRSYINNPWRVLRKYGHVKVVESFYAILWADYGYKLDAVVTADTPGNWVMSISLKNEIHLVRKLTATNMTDLGYQIVRIVEDEILKSKQ